MPDECFWVCITRAPDGLHLVPGNASKAAWRCSLKTRCRLGLKFKLLSTLCATPLCHDICFSHQGGCTGGTAEPKVLARRTATAGTHCSIPRLRISSSSCKPLGFRGPETPTTTGHPALKPGLWAVITEATIQYARSQDESGR